jgi:hypothetical protein
MDEIKQLRYSSKDEYTLSSFIINDNPFCVVLEDEHRDKKVMHETRIPAGEYMLGIRKELTEMTQRYRKKFDWFKFHIEILNVKNFSGIYIHIGNTDKDTSGCLLLGQRPFGFTEKNKILESTITFKKFYDWAYSKLEKGQEIKLIIKDVL